MKPNRTNTQRTPADRRLAPPVAGVSLRLEGEAVSKSKRPPSDEAAEPIAHWKNEDGFTIPVQIIKQHGDTVVIEEVFDETTLARFRFQPKRHTVSPADLLHTSPVTTERLIQEALDTHEDWGVMAPGQWENDDGPRDWWAVVNDNEGIIAYFFKEADADTFCRHKQDP